MLRTPKIVLKPLKLRAMIYSYESILGIKSDEALQLGKSTNGYACGYKLLGNLLYRSDSRKISKKLMVDYDLLLEDNIYAKIWSSLRKKGNLLCDI